MAKSKPSDGGTKASELLGKLARERAVHRLQHAWGEATAAFMAKFTECAGIDYYALDPLLRVRCDLPGPHNIEACLQDTMWGYPALREAYQKLQAIYTAETAKEFEAVVAKVEALTVSQLGGGG